MTNDLDLRNTETIARASHRLLETTEVDIQECPHCKGTGLTWNEMWGCRCPWGCPISEDALKESA